MTADSRTARQRRRFVLVSATVALSLLGDTLLYAVLPARSEDFGVLVWQVGILLGANRVIRLLTNELAGRAIRRFGPRPLLLGAVIVGSLVTAGYTLPFGFWWLLTARMLWGACWSILRVEGYLAVLGLAGSGNRGRIFGLYHAVIWTGAGGGVLVGGFLCDLWGIQPTFALFALLAAGGVALAAGAPLSDIKRWESPGEAVRRAAPRDGAPLFLWFCAFALTMAGQMIANLTGRLASDRILPAMAGLPVSLGAASLAGLLLSIRSVQNLVLGPLAGHISDRFGRIRLLGIVCGLQILLIGGLGVSRSWWLIILFLLLQFAAAVSARLLLEALAGDLAPAGDEAVFMSRFSTFVDLGTALGPVAAFSLYAGIGFGWVAGLAAGLLLSALLTLAAGGLRVRGGAGGNEGGFKHGV